MNHRFVISALALSCSVFACDKSPEKAQSEAAEAQQNADMTQARNQNTANEKASQARAILVDAQKDFSTKTEERLGKLDTRLIELRQKIAKATTVKTPRAELERKIDDVVAQLAQARITLAEAGKTADATQFAGARARLDVQVNQIDVAIEGLERSV